MHGYWKIINASSGNSNSVSLWPTSHHTTPSILIIFLQQHVQNCFIPYIVYVYCLLIKLSQQFSSLND